MTASPHRPTARRAELVRVLDGLADYTQGLEGVLITHGFHESECGRAMWPVTAEDILDTARGIVMKERNAGEARRSPRAPHSRRGANANNQ